MHRIAFTMQVDPAHHEEYIKRHHPIWTDLEQTLKDHGVVSYSIFLDPNSSLLFAYAEVESLSRWKLISETEVFKKWWVFMRDIMQANLDGSPISGELKEVYHLRS